MITEYALGHQISFNPLKRQIYKNEHVVNIGGRESSILKLLCDDVNSVVRKECIQQTVWNNVYVGETSLTKAISNLRKSLCLFDGLTCEIKTVSGEGYVLIIDDGTFDVFFTEDFNLIEVKSVTECKSKHYDDSAMFSIAIGAVRAEFSLNMIFLLVCFTSSILASLITSGFIFLFNIIG
ncbi:winged helix-turn-helix domain-containing protein [Shewanella sp. M16]|uniref:winged helix-turn-helix domain-containing protein n=1 Tax=Shewanella sp. M16 TaxID=2830837 RepID=UPI001BAFAD32|nr:winged helix-turn-helix domain-containing protein [Shewanella sp. M16]MBS0044980.1 winged helix-turn-helix domain-containing protein [Shewanella sp. M16]